MGQLDHFMPLYVGDYLRDTPHLSVEEHGAYLLLLMALWTKGTLPASPDALARVARVTPYRWAKLAPILMPFFTVADGMLRHKRVDSERSHSIEVASKRSAAGKAGGEAKALKTQEAALANATILPQQKATIHIHNHSHKEEREKTERPRESRAAGASALVSDFDRFWTVYPKRIGQNPKHPASLKFLRAVKQGADPEAIIASARRYAIECSGIEDRTFVTQAVTWLNQRRWEDGPGLLPEGAEMPKTTGPPAPGLPTEEELREKYRKIKANGNGHDAGNTARDVRAQGHGVHSGAEGGGYGPGDGDPSRH